MIGIVADDVTGANDIGIMFAKANYTTDVYNYKTSGETIEKYGSPDVLVFDTDSRFDAYQDAYEKVFNTTKRLMSMDYKAYFKKTCSVGRGNFGAEFDAMLDALDEEFMIVVLGYPKTGRTTINGIHYVHGVLLENSEFRNDPVHPRTQSNLVDIIQSQTKRKVTSIGYEVLEKGPEALRAEIAKLRPLYNYVIIDVVDQSSLSVIAKAVYDQKIFGGSSALSEELAVLWGKKTEGRIVVNVPKNENLGVLCAAGSLMPQTSDQISYMKKRGAEALELDTLKLFNENKINKYKDQLVAQLSKRIASGKDIIFHTKSDEATVNKTRIEGARRGLSKTDVARSVSKVLADVVGRVVEKTGQNRLIVLGGDTSAAVCSKLNVNGMRILEELQPGLPSCLALSDTPMLLVLKSGSFGDKMFVEQAIEHLKRL